jgi:predicted phosphodiesterase
MKKLSKQAIEAERNRHGKDRILDKIAARFTPAELHAIASGEGITRNSGKAARVDFSGDRIRFGVFADTHIGHVNFSPDRLYQVFETFEKEKCEFAMLPGDVTEGLSNRPDHVYELNAIGYTAQLNLSVKMLSEYKKPLYIIDGNHDRWFIKSGGALIVPAICDRVPGAVFLGHDEGDLVLKNKVRIKMFHGEDGASYALSYRLQRIVENIAGGDKPHVLLCGNAHKSMWLPSYRNVEGLESGCIQTQTKWMRGKKLPAHVGFWIVDVWCNKTGLGSMACRWFPFYA